MADTKAFNRMIKAAQHLCAEHEAQSVSDGDVFDLFRAIIAADYATADVKTLNRQLANTEAALAECEREKAELREKLVDLALRLAAHETAEDRKRILESEDVRSIMDLRLR
jgi:hypothetical protein